MGDDLAAEQPHKAKPVPRGWPALLTAAERASGRALTPDEVQRLERAAVTPALLRQPAEFLEQAAAMTLRESSRLEPYLWLENVRELRRAAAVRSLQLDRPPSGVSLARCTRCGNLLGPRMVCGCATPENAGRPGS